MKTPSMARTGLAAMLLCALAPAARAEIADTTKIVHDPERFGIVVSATKSRKDPIEVPNATLVVSGERLRTQGAQTLADALQDVVGLDTGDGSDNGMRLPNIGLWGLKEFDALLITVDGVPVGGPFNPSLAQISLEDVDRIEIVKGPQGTLHGVSAFAGMVQVFTREHEEGLGQLTMGGGSFSNAHGSAAIQREFHGTTVRLSGALQRADGWQDRTSSDFDRGTLSLGRKVGRADLALDLGGHRDTQLWGTPMPYDAGRPVAGFLVDHNYAVGGARSDHHLWTANARASLPLENRFRLENVFGCSRDDQNSVRSFPDPGAAFGDTVPSAGVAIRPLETTLFDDLRLHTDLSAGGRHELLTGAAITWGKTTADGIGFDFDQVPGEPVPQLGAIPVGDVRSFSDRRTFLGAYARDEWTPQGQSTLTLSGGGRYDHTHETLHAQAQEQAPASPLEVADDERTVSAWSGDLSALVRLIGRPTASLDAVNLYGTWRSAFKPAAPNPAEAEGAEILDPERTHSIEGGVKARGFNRQVGLDVSLFDMTFNNLVVSTLGPDTLPALINAGEERFKGIEASLSVSPDALPGTTLSLGYAHHDPRFVRFTFVTPDGQLHDVSGKRLELAPQDMFNARLAWQAPRFVGGFVAMRRMGGRPLTRRNGFWAEGYVEWDAGASCEVSKLRITVTGRNLGDDRHLVGESDLGDSQFYVAPPRRVIAEVTYRL